MYRGVFLRGRGFGGRGQKDIVRFFKSIYLRRIR